MNNKILKKKSQLQAKKQPQDNKNNSYSQSSSDEEQQDPEFENLDDAEDLEDYKTDGYHPVYLGEMFKDGRYKVVQKLGWGHFSTVWLAYDKQTEEYVALKIQKSKKSYQESAIDEMELLEDLKKNQFNVKWTSFVQEYNKKQTENNIISENETFCIKFLDKFIHFGMHGKHYCSVFEIMGPNLLDLIQHFNDRDARIEDWLVKLIAKQCLLGFVYMHETCNIIHTDIKPENVMIQLKKEYFECFLEEVKSIQKKPISMLFLKKQLQNTNKNNKKKNKKKQNKISNAKGESQQSNIDQTKEIQEEFQNILKENKIEQKENKTEQKENGTEQKENIIQAHESKISKEEIKPKTEENKIQSEQQTQQEENKEQNQQTTQIQEEEEQKTPEPDELNIKDTENAQNTQVINDEDKKQENDDLYTLVWKEKIRIKLDKTLKIKIVDFGNACWVNKKFSNTIQTREYRAPEVILGIDYSTNTDVFSLACMIYELITNDYLFRPKKREGTSKSDEHLALFQECLGKFSKQFCLSGTKSRDYFNKNGQLIRIKTIIEYPISQILIKEYEVDKKSAQEIEDFLMPMLNYNPKKRSSAVEAVNHNWLYN